MSLHPFERFKRLIAVDKKYITQVYIYALFNGLVNLSLPLGIQAIINLIQGGEMSTAWIMMVVIVIVGIAMTGLFQLMQLRIVENISQKIFTRSAFEFAYRIPRIKYKSLYNYYAPELANRFFDTLTIQKGLPKILIDFSLAAFQILVGLFVLSLYHSFFVFFSILMLAVVYVIIAFSGPRGLATSLQESKFKYKVAHWLEEIARTKLSFKLSSNNDIAVDKTNINVVNYLESREKHFGILISHFYFLIGFKLLVAAGFLFMGSVLVFRQEMNIGQFVAAEIIILLIFNSVEKLINTLDSIYDVLTALEKIGYVTDMPLDQDSGYCIDEQCNSIKTTLTNVTFSYPDSNRKVLENVSFEIPEGKSVAIIGRNGSGKSTLMQLLAGIFDTQSGIIKYNDIPIATMDMERFRSYVGYTLNNNQIFLGTLIENITLDRDGITASMVNEAIKKVKLEDFVSTLEEGLNTPLDPDGRRIPRSVSNKIILARAIVSNPKLLILEDPLDHVVTDEKEEIVNMLIAPENPWQIIVTSVDTIWETKLGNTIELNDGHVLSVNINK